MKTLSEILKFETSVPVIFGHVHRRQHELGFLRTDAYEWDFSILNARDLHDFAFCLNFFEFLSESYKCRSISESRAMDETEKAVSAAARALGSDNLLGITRPVAHHAAEMVMFGSYLNAPSGENKCAYRAIYPHEMQFARPDAA